MNISVIIPTYNRISAVLEFIKRLENEVNPLCSIIVIDQSDDQDNKIHFKRYQENPNIHYFQQEEKGTGKARNFGALRTDSEWLCFLDDDVRPSLGYFDGFEDIVSNNSWVDVIQPNLLQRDQWKNYQASPKDWLRNYIQRQSMIREHPQKHLDGVQWFLSRTVANYTTSTLCLGSGAFFIRRKAFLRVGGFDENFSGIGDDRDLLMRLWWYGYRMIYSQKIIAFHLHQETGGLRDKKEQLTRHGVIPDPDPGIILFYKKWFPGFPTTCFYLAHIMKRIRKPHTFLFKLLQLRNSISIANYLLKKNPQYICGNIPLPRPENEYE